MKSILTFIPVTFVILLISFKITSAQTKFGIRAGLNAASAQMEYEDGSETSTQSIPGMHIGLTVEIPINSGFYLQPAALYSRKGFKQKGNWFSGTGNEFKAKANYIEIPVNLLYKHPIGAGNLLLGAGPYAGYGLGGSWEADSDVLIGDIMIENYGDVIFKNNVKDGEFGNYLYGKPWDYGVNFLAGYEFFEAFSVQVNAQLGLANLEPDVDGQQRDDKFKNTSVGISIGYKFP